MVANLSEFDSENRQPQTVYVFNLQSNKAYGKTTASSHGNS